MEQLLVAIFDSVEQAHEGAQILKKLHKDGKLTVYGGAVIAKDGAGIVRVVDEAEHGPLGAFIGMLVGGLIGLLAGPFGAAFGVAGGGFLGTMYEFVHAGIDEDFVNEVADHLLPGKAALIAHIDEERELPLDDALEAAGGVVFRQPYQGLGHLHLERDVEALHREIAALKAEQAQAMGEDRAKLQAKIDAAEAKLRRKLEYLRAADEKARQVAEAKVRSLETQAAQARGERKEWLTRRAAQVRAEDEERHERLRQMVETPDQAAAA